MGGGYVFDIFPCIRIVDRKLVLINDKFDLERSPDLVSFHMRPITELRPALIPISIVGIF